MLAVHMHQFFLLTLACIILLFFISIFYKEYLIDHDKKDGSDVSLQSASRNVIV